MSWVAALRTPLILLVAVVSCAACTRFENPIEGKDGVELDDAILGNWRMERPEGRMDLSIIGEGGSGMLVAEINEQGKDPEDVSGRVLTAKIESHNFLSLRETGASADGWRFFRYEISGARFRLYPDADKFWMNAIKNKVVTGRIEKEKGLEYAVVTASGEELYSVVRGYSAVIFSDEMIYELVRVPDDDANTAR